MMNFLDSIVISSGYLNTANDSIQGQSVQPDALWGYGGLLGKIVQLDGASAAKYSDTSVSTLAGGFYQYVKAATALVKGDVVAWTAVGASPPGEENFQVTHTLTAPLEGQIAGVALGTVTSGNYGWIQVGMGGLAWVNYRATVTDKTAGNLVLQLTTTATADAIADATGTYISGGVKGLKNIIGTAYDTPTDGGFKRINLRLPFNFG